jgi:hypothetical protein
MYFRTVLALALTTVFAAGAGSYVALDDSFPDNYTVSIVAGTLNWGAVGFATGLLVGVIRDNRFQFTIRNLVVATLWVAVCCMAWRGFSHYVNPTPYPLYLWVAAYNFRYLPIPAAIGSLFGRTWFGLAIGLGLSLFWTAVTLFLLYGGFVFI